MHIKFKFNKKATVIASLAILVIAILALNSYRSGQTAERDDLLLQKETAHNLASKFSGQKQGLQTQLTQVQSRLSEAQSNWSKETAVFPSPDSDTGFGETLLDIAGSSGVQIKKMQTGVPSSSNQNADSSLSFQVEQMKVTVQGRAADSLDDKINNITRFIHALSQQSSFANVQINGATLSGMGTDPVMELSLSIYFYKKG